MFFEKHSPTFVLNNTFAQDKIFSRSWFITVENPLSIQEHLDIALQALWK